jgi:hypothetical protein
MAGGSHAPDDESFFHDDVTAGGQVVDQLGFIGGLVLTTVARWRLIS